MILSLFQINEEEQVLEISLCTPPTTPPLLQTATCIFMHGAGGLILGSILTSSSSPVRVVGSPELVMSSQSAEPVLVKCMDGAQNALGGEEDGA